MQHVLFFVKPIMLRTVFRVFRKGIDYLRDLTRLSLESS
jgi:hypothetical protein